MSRDVVVALVGAPYDGAATLGWPGARYAPGEYVISAIVTAQGTEIGRRQRAFIR